jgi:hypothetical protein
MMADQAATTYIVSVFEKPHWRTVLVTKDMAKAEAMVEEIGGKVAHRGDHPEAEKALGTEGRRPAPVWAGALIGTGLTDCGSAAAG